MAFHFLFLFHYLSYLVGSWSPVSPGPTEAGKDPETQRPPRRHRRVNQPLFYGDKDKKIKKRDKVEDKQNILATTTAGKPPLFYGDKDKKIKK